MKVKETIRTTRYDDKGRPVVTDRTIYYETIEDRINPFVMRDNWDGMHRSSFGRIFDSYRDYCESQRWD